MKLVVDNTKKRKRKVKRTHQETVTVGKNSWRYNKTKGEYSKRDILFNSIECKAWLNNRWLFIAKIGPHVALNVYAPTIEAALHIDRTKALLEHLGIEITVTINAPCSLDELLTAKNHFEEKRDRDGLRTIKELLRYKK